MQAVGEWRMGLGFYGARMIGASSPWKKSGSVTEF